MYKFCIFVHISTFATSPPPFVLFSVNFSLRFFFSFSAHISFQLFSAYRCSVFLQKSMFRYFLPTHRSTIFSFSPNRQIYNFSGFASVDSSLCLCNKKQDVKAKTKVSKLHQMKFGVEEETRRGGMFHKLVSLEVVY